MILNHVKFWFFTIPTNLQTGEVKNILRAKINQIIETEFICPEGHTLQGYKIEHHFLNSILRPILRALRPTMYKRLSIFYLEETSEIKPYPNDYKYLCQKRCISNDPDSLQKNISRIKELLYTTG